jgi:hypothetical protein
MNDIEGIDEVLRVLNPHWDEIQSDFDSHDRRYLELAAADHDAIGRVLRAHLVVENFMDSFLKMYYGIDEISVLNFSFFQKAKLLPNQRSSATFVRPGIFQLNAVRNKFGHRLNHQIERDEICSILDILKTARPGIEFPTVVSAIEAFAPVACAFLSVPAPHIRQLFVEAFAKVSSHSPENGG